MPTHSSPPSVPFPPSDLLSPFLTRRHPLLPNLLAFLFVRCPYRPLLPTSYIPWPSFAPGISSQPYPNSQPPPRPRPRQSCFSTPPGLLISLLFYLLHEAFASTVLVLPRHTPAHDSGHLNADILQAHDFLASATPFMRSTRATSVSKQSARNKMLPMQ